MPVKKPVYTKKDPLTHILDRPDMYVGSVRAREIEEFVVVNDRFQIAKKKVNLSPAIIRIFVEPLSNIIDNVARSKKSKKSSTKIAISIDKKSGEISMWNDGEIIPIEMHSEEKCYNHTLIFGQLLTSSNYDDEEDRKDVSGRNGLGVKLSCVFSTRFIVEGGDPVNKKSFYQKWEGNMKKVSEPVIKPYKGKGFTKITFIPDFSRFEMEGMTDDLMAMYTRFVVDTAMLTKTPVFLNGEQIPVSTLSDYAKLYNSDDNIDTLTLKTTDCEVVLTPSTLEEFQVISFANGVYTSLGGTHVDPWTEALFRPIVSKLNKPKKPQINIADVKKFFRLFVVATVNKPEFDSQSKNKLESPSVEAVVKKTYLSTISKWPVMERLEDIIRAKEMVILKKAERKKRGYEHVEGLEPANNEGGKKGHECTLILVEGLSAKTYASCGIQKGVFGKVGRDWMGIYALRGKCLNCRNFKPVTIAKNKVVTDIIKALGIKYDLDYSIDENYKKLRYGRVLIVTDADTDGLHISGLIQNMFHALFPSLLKRDPPFITSMQTPIVRVYGKGADKLFYNENEYKKYVEKLKGKKIDKKYYKGLGSSNEDEVLETFGVKMVEFVEDEKCHENMNKAFNSKHADTRKQWLEKYDPDSTAMNWNGNKSETISVSFSDYINTELIKFSIDDCKRSIPHLMDGLKEGHRKVLYTCFNQNLKHNGKSIKVAQLAGLVSSKTNYHHGEHNLELTMTNMANCYVGSNNIPLLYRDGQFGSRSEGGHDASAGRYIWTKLDAVTRLIFREEDDVLLEYIEDDGDKVEPKFYVPIIPMILVNGCIAGIGTGWSCSVPCYNPLDVIASVKAWMENGNKAYEDEDGDEEPKIKISLLPEIKPWYRGHTGEMVSEGDGKYTSWGRVDVQKGKPHVTELPVGYWTSKFASYLGGLAEEKQIVNYKNYSTPKTISFVITESEDGLKCTTENLKLFSTIRTTNMVLFSDKGKIKKYGSVDEIIEVFCKVRYSYYVKRKAYILKNLEREIKMLGNKKRFLQEVRDGVFRLFDEVKGKRQSRKTVDVVADLEKSGYDRSDESEDENPDDEEEPKKGGYNYLLRLQISSITAEKINKLEKDIENKISERDELKGTSERELWTRDLDEFQEAYVKWLPVLANEKISTKSTKKK